MVESISLFQQMTEPNQQTGVSNCKDLMSNGSNKGKAGYFEFSSVCRRCAIAMILPNSRLLFDKVIVATIDLMKGLTQKVDAI